MAIITKRGEALKIIDKFRERKVSMAIFCTASHWNTEAILMAASRFACEHGLRTIPLAVAMTYNYRYMAQAGRVTHCGDLKTGFLSIMEHLRLLCYAPDSPYANVTVLPHLDHADPERDWWALTEGLPYLASVMFDAQKYTSKENRALTSDYIRVHGKDILVEGIMEELSVEGKQRSVADDTYIDKANQYCTETGVDFLVADLGTEQQSTGTGQCVYLGERARELTACLGKSMLVLHGTSCLEPAQMSTISTDGIIRVNMWTRIAREAGIYAANRQIERMKESPDSFDTWEPCQYLRDTSEKAAGIMAETLEILGYDRFD